VGLPIGGRRVIGERITDEEEPNAMGRIELEMFLQFEEPGRFVLPETVLLCAQLAKPDSTFARYAAHFNNSLFVPVENFVEHRVVYTSAPPVEIEVLPLPKADMRADFSNLFHPVEIDISIGPKTAVVGQLMDLQILLKGVPHGMVDLPALEKQKRIRTRFVIDAEYRRFWDEEGSLFKTRIRPLSTSITALPSLEFQIFDPENGVFEYYKTDPIPLTILPNEGRTFVPLQEFEGATVELTDNPDGIWHNLERNRMNDLFTLILVSLRDYAIPLLLAGPILFFLFLPIARERRRRSLDEAYRLRIEAYKRFKRLPQNSPEKWTAFTELMAVSFHSGKKAWTTGDSEAALQSIGASDTDIQQLLELHQAFDAHTYSKEAPSASAKNLNGVASRIIRLLAKSALILILSTGFMAEDLQAGTWTKADDLFDQALAAPSGSDESANLYREAALAYQAASNTNRASADALYNAGNAWFQADEIGRSIAAYRTAQTVRPFDRDISQALMTARSMSLNFVPGKPARWSQLPTLWITALSVVFSMAFWIMAILYIRYQNRWLLGSLALTGAIALFLLGSWTLRDTSGHQDAVLIVDGVPGRKGPSYAYDPAFSQPLHDGLEFTVIEYRSNWARAQLTDGRQCWLPESQFQVID
jgi:tetratricopeptide (TPR) repeat protein